MSVYVAIIEAEIVRPQVAAELPKAEMLMNAGGDQRYYLGLSSDPEMLRRSMFQVFPFVRYRVIHAIRAENRADLLYEALRMKLREKHIVHSWYNFSPDDLIWLRSITHENMAQMIPQIENEIAKASGVEVKDVTRRKAKRVMNESAPEPEMSIEEIEAMKQRLLEQANMELY